jgi:hypothetical protein
LSGINEFERIERNYRGTTFILQEADVATYDKCLKKATKQVEDPVTGQDTEEVDENLLLRLLLRECMIEPKVSDFTSIGVRLMRQLERDVRDLHFNIEPATKSQKSKKDEKDVAAEDDGSPNED